MLRDRHDGQFTQPASRQRPSASSDDTEILSTTSRTPTTINIPPGPNLLLAKPPRDEAPFEASPPPHRHNIIARPTATPQAGLRSSKFMVQRLVDASPHGVLTLRREIVFYAVPEDEDDDEHGDGDYEPPF